MNRFFERIAMNDSIWLPRTSSQGRDTFQLEKWMTERVCFRSLNHLLYTHLIVGCVFGELRTCVAKADLGVEKRKGRDLLVAKTSKNAKRQMRSDFLCSTMSSSRDQAGKLCTPASRCVWEGTSSSTKCWRKSQECITFPQRR